MNKSFGTTQVLQAEHYRWIAGIILASSLIGAIAPPPAAAQITPDQTLGNEGSRVTRNVTIRGGNGDRIDGGAARGSNLFHSFSEFNVNDGQRVYFANPTGIANILGRVTGNTRSDIQGTLGVDGSANLFLLNPNGIIFGPNARLDVSGSFTASTANSFTFPDGSEFSAANPGDSSLLSVAVPLGVQYGAIPPGAITNAGNLAVGQNLSLSGGSVTSTGQLAAPSGQLLVEGVAGDVQVRQATAQAATFTASNNLILQDSQLQTAGDLNLLAGNTVQIRDSVANPFGAYAGGNLTVQGNQNVDIFALNHPSSGLVSGGDMVLRSPTAVGGDAHYWTGGSFRVEQLDGRLGNLYSPYDPIIRSLGDVSFNAYIGNSLHILAAGDVNVPGFIQVLGKADPGEAAISDPGFVLSNNAPFPINGLTEPTVDIRAGVNPNVIGTEQLLLGTAQFFSLSPTSPPPIDSANISVGTIILGGVASADLPPSYLQGRILLTNRYEPDPNNLVSGNIRVFNTQTNLDNNPDLNGVAIRSETPNGGGFVAIDSRGDINIAGRINANAVSTGTGPNSRPIYTANGGDVTLLANGNITFEEGTDDLRRGIDSTGAAGGDITLVARNNITLVGRNSFILSENRGNGNGGDINISTGNLVVGNGGRILARNAGGVGNAGSVTITATDRVTIAGFENNGDATVGSDVANGGTGNGNNLTITARSIDITNNAIVAASIINGQGPTRIIDGQETTTRAQAGNVTITATGTGSQDRVFVSNSVIFSEVGNSSVGNGGTISINAARVSLSNGATLGTNVRGSSTGDGGDIRVTAGSLTATGGSQLFASTSGNGNAGNIRITADDTVSFSGRGFNFARNGLLNEPEDSQSGAFAQTDSAGRAGSITIHAPQLTLRNDAFVSARTLSSGQGGSIFLRPNLNGRSLIISVFGNSSQISASTSSTGNAGSMQITAPDSVRIRGGGLLSVQSNSGATGGAGRLLIETERLTVSGGTQVSARTLGSGQGGTIFLRPNPNGRSLTVNLLGQDLSGTRSQISASTSGTGEGGDMEIRALDSVRIGGGGLLSVQSNRSATGGAGRLLIETERLTVSGRTRVSAQTFSSGQGGTIFLRPNPSGRSLTVNLSDNSQISASTFSTGEGGDMRITAPDSITLTGGGRLTVEATETGPAGDLFIRTGQLNINNGVQVSAQANRSAAGNVTINARRATVSGNSSVSASNASFRTSNTDANQFRFGNVRLRILDALVVNSGSEITASTETGQAGGVLINAQNSVEISGNSRLAVEATGVGGQAGNLSIRTGRLTLQSGSTATVESPNGQAGDLSVRANRVTLDNSTLNANAGAAGPNNANINLTISGPLVRLEGTRPRSQRTSTTRNALISANATGATDGGNITINAENGFVLANANDNADITANATDGAGQPSGDGGRVTITANAIFGLERRDQETLLSDITATSQSGNTGTIALNTLNVDPTRGLGELPVDIVDTTALVVDGCVGGSQAGVTDQGEFTRTGRGGLSLRPSDPLSSEGAIAPLATLDSSETPSGSASISDAPHVQPLVEAQGLGLNAEGKVSLMTGSSTITSPAIEQSSTCRVPAL